MKKEESPHVWAVYLGLAVVSFALAAWAFMNPDAGTGVRIPMGPTGFGILGVLGGVLFIVAAARARSNR